MQGELSHLRNRVAPFEEPARGLVPEVVKYEVLDTQHLAGIGEGSADTPRVIGEDELAFLRLTFNDLPGFRGILEAAVIASFPGGVLRVANETSPTFGVIVLSPQPADFGFPASRMDGKPHDIRHRDLRPPIPALEIIREHCQLLGRRSDFPAFRATQQSKLIAGCSGGLYHGRIDAGVLTGVLRRPQDAADPGQVVRDCAGGGASGPARAYVVDEDGRSEGRSVQLSDIVSLEVFKRGLLCATPGCDGFEVVDVPAN